MFEKELEALNKSHLARTIIDRESPQGQRIILNGRQVLNFSSNDYLGLANHPSIIKAVNEFIKRFGYGSGASRLLAGGTSLHRELEDKIALFKGTESAVVFNSGYAANTGTIPAIAGDQDIIFSDKLNHASIIDGCRLSRAKTLIYRHKDISHLEDLVRKESMSYRGDGRFVVITDTVFSMDGDIAPLNDIYDLCISLHSSLSTQHSILLYIDDAHGTGVLGAGKGALTHFNIKSEPWIIQMGTFSKALGSFGAFAAGSKDVIEWITNTARSLIFSTALPACAAAAALRAFYIIEERPELISRLWSRRERLVSALKEVGCDTGESRTPIIPLITGDLESTVSISSALFENGIYAPAIRPPSVKIPRVRITVTAGHSEEDIDRLAEAVRKALQAR
ncbi:MAG: 8-amino-7-oxononanoate synthase [Nitrospirota bacterium]